MSPERVMRSGTAWTYWGAWGSRTAYLRAMVPKLGAHAVAEALRESPDQVAAECEALGIPIAPPKGHRYTKRRSG